MNTKEPCMRSRYCTRGINHKGKCKLVDDKKGKCLKYAQCIKDNGHFGGCVNDEGKLIG